MFAIGDYTFAPWKVVWREQASQMIATLAGLYDGKPIMPDHKLMLVDCDSAEEGHYVCAALNSNVSRFGVMAYAIGTQMDPHILEHIRIPKYDPANPVHQALADASREAHAAAAQDDAKRLSEIEKRIDQLAAQLWGLIDKELVEIQKGLRE
jgi:hypothetical protein